VDELWHRAILDTRFYSKLSTALSYTIEHDPSGAKDNQKEQRQKRLDRMKREYKYQFGLECLQLQLRDLNNRQTKKRKVAEQSLHGVKAESRTGVKMDEMGIPVGSTPQEEDYQELEFMDFETKNICLRIRKNNDQSIASMAAEACGKLGMNRDAVHFLLDCKVLKDVSVPMVGDYEIDEPIVFMDRRGGC